MIEVFLDVITSLSFDYFLDYLKDEKKTNS